MHAEFIIEPNTRAQYPDGLHKVRLKRKPKLLLSTLRLSNTNKNTNDNSLFQTAGPFDIALIKLNEGVALVPGKIVPVRQTVR